MAASNVPNKQRPRDTHGKSSRSGLRPSHEDFRHALRGAFDPFNPQPGVMQDAIDAGQNAGEGICSMCPPFGWVTSIAEFIQIKHNYNLTIASNVTVTPDTVPIEGNMLIAVVSQESGFTTPFSIAATLQDPLWTKIGTTGGLDMAQYGGPGNAVQADIYIMTVPASPSASYVMLANSAHHLGFTLMEVSGIESVVGIVTDSYTMTAGNTYVTPPVTGTGFYIGGFVMQGTDYAPDDAVTPVTGTEVRDAANDNTGQRPHIWIAYGQGSDVTVSGAPVANAFLDRWGAGTWGVMFAPPSASQDPEAHQFSPLERSTGNGLTLRTTNFPYDAGSLLVFADGIQITVTETDPDAGTFTLPRAYAAPVDLVWKYQATRPEQTASNPAATAIDHMLPRDVVLKIPPQMPVFWDSGDDGRPDLPMLPLSGKEVPVVSLTRHYEVLMASGITDPPDPVVSSDGTDWLYGVVE